MAGVERDEVGRQRPPRCRPAPAPSACAPPAQRRVEQRAPVRAAGACRARCARGAPAAANIRAAAARRQRRSARWNRSRCRSGRRSSRKRRASKSAVAEIGLGDRAKAGDRAARGKAVGLGLGHVGRVDQAPAPVDLGVGEQPFDRPRARPGEAVLDLLHLLGDVDVDRAVAGQRDDRAPALPASPRAGCAARRRPPRRQVLRPRARLASSSRAKRSTIVDEAPLALVRRGAAEARMRVEDRQQRQADAGLGGRRGDPLGHLGDVGIGPCRRGRGAGSGTRRRA